MIYITRDTHGDFDRLIRFCSRFQTTREDTMIILGDAGFNYYGGISIGMPDIIIRKRISTGQHCCLNQSDNSANHDERN